MVHTSALLAIPLDEAEALDFAGRIANASQPALSAASYVEFGLLAAARHGYDRRKVDEAIIRLGLDVVAVSPEHAQLAVEAFTRFGKGRHAAGLNFGDCFAYALAKDRGWPLLYKGNDLARTDVVSAMTPLQRP